MALKHLELRWESLSTGVVPVTYTFVRHYLLTCCSQHPTLVHTLLHLCCAGIPAHVSHTPVLPTGYMTVPQTPPYLPEVTCHTLVTGTRVTQLTHSSMIVSGPSVTHPWLALRTPRVGLKPSKRHFTGLMFTHPPSTPDCFGNFLFHLSNSTRGLPGLFSWALPGLWSGVAMFLSCVGLSQGLLSLQTWGLLRLDLSPSHPSLSPCPAWLSSLLSHMHILVPCHT